MNINDLVEKCYNALPTEWRQRPWEHLNHGRAVLNSEEQLNAYIAAYGEMHIVKCRMAMQNFPFENLVFLRTYTGEISEMKNFELYDWGCGQGLGSLVFLQMLRERDMLSGLRRVTLIEPSVSAITRAENWLRQLSPRSTEIRTINRYIPANGQPAWSDIKCHVPIAIHIFSNILDIREVGLKWLARQTCDIAPQNIVVCVGPPYGGSVSRISDFHNLLGGPVCFSDFSRYPCAYTSKTRHPFGIEAKCFTFDSESGFNSQYSEQSKQTYIDEYKSIDECLTGVLPDSVISAYHNLLNASQQNSFELYLRPSIGIERPDFILANISRGAVIINICEDIYNFGKEYERVEAIKGALIDIYIKSLKIGTILAPETYNTIKVGLYFPAANPEDVQQACASYYNKILQSWEQKEKQRKEECDNEGKQYIVGKKPINGTIYLIKLFKGNCQKELKTVSCRGFRYDFYCEIKETILGRWHSYSQGDQNLRLTKIQNELIVNNSSRLKIKGVAGSGKTQIVAHKAVKEHLRTGSKVLIVTFNISLICYIKMRINQVPADFSTDAFEIINYHQFFMCKARRYHGDHIPFGASDDPDFFERYKDEIKKNKDQYDTIIVDEAQDYESAWFDCLRKYFLTDKGKIILCGDGEQNIYNREVSSLTKMPKVHDFGKNNHWRSISERVSWRILNPEIAILASRFAREFKISDETLKNSVQLNISDDKLGYWYSESAIEPDRIAANIEWIIAQYKLNHRDVVILGQAINLLREVDCNIREKFHHKTMTTFESKEDYDRVKSKSNGFASLELDLKAIRRVAKVHFTTDTDKLKLATIQSFKGWESKSIILIIQSEKECENEINEDVFVLQTRQNIPAHIYTAITRARENLFILNFGNQKYHDFFKDQIHNK